MTKLSVIAAALALLAVGINASALPVTNDEVIPGAGLPSLESLGLTSRDLLAMGPIEITESFKAERDLLLGKRGSLPTCQNNYKLPRSNALACINYLKALGDTSCAVTGRYVQQMCSSGGAAIMGANIFGYASVASKCSHAAMAAQWSYDNCAINTVDMQAGAQFAYGNGDLLISIVPN